MRRSRLIVSLVTALAAVVVIVLAATGQFSSSTGGKGSHGGGPHATGSQPPAGSVKPVIQGLLDRQGPPPDRLLSVVHAYVVKVNWADLQPAAFGPIAANNAIDQAIARVQQPDYAQAGVVLKLRVFAGIGAPEWAKELGGAPLPYVDNQSGASVSGGTIGRFWTADFGRAYADLQTKLAAKYDTVAQVREITVSRCTTIFDEPFVRQFGDARNVAAMRGAGYTLAADKQCIADSIAEHAVWQHTTSDVDFSPMPNIDKPGDTRDLTFAEAMMRYCRMTLGARCGLQNNALATSKLNNSTFAQMYQYMTSLGPPIELQTAATKRIGDESTALAAAVTIGANSVELPSGYGSWSESLLSSTASGLVGNRTH
jgi:hypothetical protein